MAIPDIRQRSGYLFLVVAVGHIILISTQVNSRSGVPLLQAFVFGVFAQVQRGTSAVVGGARGTWDGYVALQGVRTDNLALRQRVRELEVKLQRERALAGESETLRRLLELRDHSQVPTRAAEIIGTSPTSEFRAVTIDRGTNDGVRNDMAVVSPAGAVGRVVMQSRRAAKVQLLIDRNAAVAVMVERSRAQAIAMGNGENVLRLDYLSSSADIQKGDTLVTSGIDGIYPRGFLVGRVEEIERAGGTFRSVRVRPTVDFSALEEVLVVLAPPTFVGPEAPAVPAGPSAPRKDPGAPQAPTGGAERRE
jgi:rod shape-determining protein MreC